MSKSSRVTELLAVTSRLIACLQQEVEAIRAMRPEKLKKMQVEKVALADTYRAFMLAMKEPRDESHAISEALKDELVEATERVQAAVSENLRALRAMRDVNERVMRAVVSTLEEKRSSVTGYDARGSLRKGRRNVAVEPAAVQQRA
jgi:Skp family chaperone for outer membrane proteins